MAALGCGCSRAGSVVCGQMGRESHRGSPFVRAYVEVFAQRGQHA